MKLGFQIASGAGKGGKMKGTIGKVKGKFGKSRREGLQTRTGKGIPDYLHMLREIPVARTPPLS